LVATHTDDAVHQNALAPENDEVNYKNTNNSLGFPRPAGPPSGALPISDIEYRLVYDNIGIINLQYRSSDVVL
jgi:hypothetical protein